MIISADDLDHLEALAEGGIARKADPAERAGRPWPRKSCVRRSSPANVAAIGNRVTYTDELSGR
ncbi:hypothetical protein [Thioclava sp. NG1]|uniref:hypothetical protein n=1 Tax=Thioclava sp. NG1 TaxID=2182426 RepID=UPI003F92D8A5